MKTLSNYISGRYINENTRSWEDLNEDLTHQDCEDIANLLGGWSKTRFLVENILRFHLKSIPNVGILERVYKDSNGWQYCAGQCYTSELATVRNHIKSI